MLDIFVEAVISNHHLPVMEFSITSGSYGSVGHATFKTDRDALVLAGIQLINDAEQLPGTLPIDIYVNFGSSRYHVFGGEYVTGKWDYDHNQVEVYARDWAGVLVDQKRMLFPDAMGAMSILTPGQVPNTGVNVQNQPLSQIVTQIANQYGLTPVLYLGGSGVGTTSSTNPTMGALYGSDDQLYMPMPETTWGVLNKLARDTGNEVYVTPDKQLVFGLPGAGLQSILVSWGLNPVPDGAFACKDLVIEHNPRRNLSFQVLVLSYDPSAAQITKGTAYVIGTNINTNDQQTVNAGIWGSNSPQTALIGNTIFSGLKNFVMPLYTFRIDGLNAAQAQTQALAIARDIAKRELIVRCSTDGILTVLPMNPTQLTGTIDSEFLNHNYWVVAYEHEFRMEAQGRAEFKTDLTLLDLRISGQGDAVTTGTKAQNLYTTGVQSSQGGGLSLPP